MKASCNCRVGLDEIGAELGLAGQLPDVTGWTVLPDWRGKPSLSVSDAAAYVAAYHKDLADRQAQQDRLNARQREVERDRQLGEVLEVAVRQREHRRKYAIQEGGRASSMAVQGLIEPGAQEAAWARGAAEAAERFDREYPLPEAP